MDEVEFVCEVYRYLPIAHRIAKTMLENNFKAAAMAVLATKLEQQRYYRER